MSKPKEAHLTVHAEIWPDYFQGHGIALTRFTDTATGIGDDVEMAADDALDMLATAGWDADKIESVIWPEILASRGAVRLTRGQRAAGAYVHVSIDVR